MKIAINTIAHVAGGGFTYLKNVMPRLADDGNEYVILVPSGRGELEEPQADNISFEHVRFPVDRLPNRMIYEQVVLPLRLAQWNVEVFFAPADVAPLLAPCPVVLAVRNINPYVSDPGVKRSWYRSLKFFIQRYLTWVSVRRAYAVFFVSNFQFECCNEFLQVPAEKASVIYHGIDRNAFEEPDYSPNSDLLRTLDDLSPYVLTVSTINEHKNFEVLLRAYGTLPPRIRASHPLVIAGRISAPNYYEYLRRLAVEEGIEDSVHFLGEVDYEEVPHLYHRAGLFVLPSKLESFGHTLVEAMASGTPIVAANATAIPEIVGDAASLFDPDDEMSLAEEIRDLLSHPEKRDELRQNGARRVLEFDWDRHVSALRSLFREATRSPTEE